jgi:hypothetical protein
LELAIKSLLIEGEAKEDLSELTERSSLNSKIRKYMCVFSMTSSKSRVEAA